MHLEDLPPNKPLPINKGFRHLVSFQLKLFADAFRDLLLSPISLVAFIIDSITKPNVVDSLSFKLMHLGRHSDKVINLFDEYTNSGSFTIDTTIADVEERINREMKRAKEKNRLEQGIEDKTK